MMPRRESASRGKIKQDEGLGRAGWLPRGEKLRRWVKRRRLSRELCGVREGAWRCLEEEHPESPGGAKALRQEEAACWGRQWSERGLSSWRRG